MDVDAVADELYGLRPEQFTAVRNERAAAARTAGDRELSERIGAMRRPSLSAWASNLLVRQQPDEIEPLVRLGEALRQAHQDLDGAQLRQLAGQQQALVRALSQQAKHLAAEAGHPIGESALQEVQETLHAVLADADAAREWAAGRLTRPLNAVVGFPAVTPATSTPRKAPTRGGPAEPAAPPREPGRASAADRARQRKQLAEARRTAESAERDVHAQEKENEAAQRAAQDARRLTETSQQHVAGLRERIAELTEELAGAEKEHRQARTDERAASERERDADRRLRAARASATKAAEQVRRLGGAGGDDT